MDFKWWICLQWY